LVPTDPGSRREGARLCPGCKEALAPAAEGPLQVDRCPQCSGTWLDRGELALLRR
ncbi:MAG: zf-TFIIB domain-containing protein, partial [Candidatus Eremiobacterota bacterium]